MSCSHSFVENKCMICTSCGVCTGYGSGCVRCRGKDRSGDKGQECGCGAGKSGCSKCGKCHTCATTSVTTSAAHNYVTSKCMICTSCGVCTGYGANCCECRGKDRTSDKGQECGCGVGESGCSSCGRCKNCGDHALCLPPTGGHNYVTNKCMICTSCGVCTGYGANCCECRGKNRSGDKGRECGCGQGASGCSSCGKCKSCGDVSGCGVAVISPGGGGVAHPGSFAGCGGNPNGITNCRGGGNCGSGCIGCGARTHWTCCSSTDASSTLCSSTVSPSQAIVNKDKVFAAHPTPIRVKDIPGVYYGAGSVSTGSAHNYVSNKCMICTSCGVCTGYGSGCVRCRGKDRSGDKGQECGCGAGKSGCSGCGKCENCGGTGNTCGGVAVTHTAIACSHNYVSNKCMICTSCGVCTGYGSGCVRCRGKDRSGDKGKECGCGAGESGCVKCGVCKNCGDSGASPVMSGNTSSSAASSGPPYHHPHSGSFPGCGGNALGMSNSKGGGNCGTFCNSCGAHTHWTCCGSTDPNSTMCLSHVSPAQAVLNKDAVFAEHSVPIQICKIPGVQYGCPHPGSFPGCGGNPDGISNCKGGGNCGASCSSCGAHTHWSCCGSTEEHSTHCLPIIAAGQAVRNKEAVFAEHSTPVKVRHIAGVNYGGGSAHNYVSDKCKICTQCAVCTGYGANCCECRGKDRSSDKGRPCGCGGGNSGCSKCGKCETCGGVGHTCSGSSPFLLTNSPASTPDPKPIVTPSHQQPTYYPPSPPPQTSSGPPGLLPFIDEWHYKDAQQQVQGPYPTASMLQWHQGGYFTEILPIKMSNWREFHPLKKVFPQLTTAFTSRVPEPTLPPPGLSSVPPGINGPPGMPGPSSPVEEATISASASTQATVNRIIDSGASDMDSGAFRSPLAGMFPPDLPIVTVEAALAPILQENPQLRGQIRTSIKMAQKKARKLANSHGHMSEDERTAIVIYTIEAQPAHSSVYYMMNAALRAVDRSAVRIWRDYIWLLLNALKKLPPAQGDMVYRAIKLPPTELGESYSIGEEFQCGSFTSTACRVEAVQHFLGTEGGRTICHLRLTEPVARDIREFSLYPQEHELLLPPNMFFQVESAAPFGNGLYFLQCRQTESIDPLISFT